MEQNIKKWLWQHERYPQFPYDQTQLTHLLSSLDYNRGLLDGISKLFREEEIKEVEIEVLIEEAMNTSEIEGEYFRRDSVRSSVRKKLDETFSLDQDSSTHRSDALIAILLDCNLNREPLTIERLHGWHNALFVGGYDVLQQINVASFRAEDKMEVVSGAIGHEKVHYLAIPEKQIKKNMAQFLTWCSNSDENIYIKSALAHLWFVAIHPYDDGNGRIARAITDYLLSEISNSSFKLYSISTAINSDRKGYYNVLDRTTNLFYNREYDFTLWVEWHLKTLNRAMEMALEKINSVIEKTKFWDKCRDKQLNTRQRKVLTKILELGKENFIGGLNTKKYMAIAKTSRATAVRDINELLAYGCIRQIEGTAGRSVRYEVLV
ncbi:MAG TPA: Fic family protein [Campylobacterales bacterium]|nr:Fic family protein [Campylobacterales bacterium]